MEKVVLKNVPPLGWGKNECTFIGALDASLRFLGEKVDYIDLMGMSRAAFRISLSYEWCPSSPDMFSRDDAASFLGYFLRRRVLNENSEDMLSVIKDELGKGRPVIAIDLVTCADWGVITGYEGDVLWCRSYYDEGEYTVAEKFPWIVYTLEKTIVPDRLQAIRKSLHLAAEQMYVKELPGLPYANGLAAYDRWISDLENEELFASLNEEQFQRYWHVNGWVFSQLYDARLAASAFLDRVAPSFSGKEKEIIEKAGHVFGSITAMLWDNWVYFPFPHWVNKDSGKTWIPPPDEPRWIEGVTWDQPMRDTAADALRVIRQKEETAFDVLASVTDCV